MSDEFDFNDGDDDTFGSEGDEELFGNDSGTDDLASEAKRETPEERDQRTKERERMRAEMGWKIPGYQEITEKLDDLSAKMPELTAEYKKLKAANKTETSEAKEILTQVKLARTLQEQIKQMEEHIDFILQGPSNFDHIIDYGSDVTTDLGGLAEKIINIQAASTDEFNVFRGSMAQVKAIAEDKDVKAALQMFKNAGSDIGGKAVEAGKEIGKAGTNVVAKTWQTLFGGKRAKEEKQQQQDISVEDALLSSLPEKHRTIKKAAKTIEELEVNLKRHAAQINALGTENLKAVNKLRSYIAAGDEIIRIYDEELIPELIKKHEREQSPDSERQLKAFEDARSDFFDQVIDLEQTMYRARRDVLKLAMQLETSREQIKTVRKMRKNGVNQWMTTLADAIMQGTTVMQNRVLLEHTDLGSDLDDIAVGLQEAGMRSQKALSESSLRQVDKLLENQGRLAKVLEEATEQKVTRTAKQLEARQKLKDAEGDLAAIQAARTKALDDSREKNRKALSAPGSDPATNDNKAGNDTVDAETDDLVAKVRRKRKAGGSGTKP